jgi:hypothetical protein
MADKPCKDQCRSGAKTACLAGRQLLLGILGVAFLTFAQPIEAWSQKPRPSGRPQQGARPGATSPRSSDWLLWGGRGRDFTAPDTELLSSWPAGGPRKIWSRNLGDSYSGIAVEGTRLYSTYRRGAEEFPGD